MNDLRRSVPVGLQLICDGSCMYSNWREMQVKLVQFSITSSVKYELLHHSYVASSDGPDSVHKIFRC